MAIPKHAQDALKKVMGFRKKGAGMNPTEQARYNKMTTTADQNLPLPSGFFPRPAPGFKSKKYPINTSRGYARDGLIEKGSAAIDWMGANVQRSLKGSETVLGVAANHAVRGAIGGAAIGGTMEAVQGGSFWDGAKAGAVNGAVGWGGYRMGMRATGATSMNPFAGINKKDPNNQGLVTAAGRMVNSMSTKSNISRQAATLLNHQQRLGLSDAVVKGSI